MLYLFTFHALPGVLRQEYWDRLPFSSLVDHGLSEAPYYDPSVLSGPAQHGFSFTADT